MKRIVVAILIAFILHFGQVEAARGGVVGTAVFMAFGASVAISVFEYRTGRFLPIHLICKF